MSYTIQKTNGSTLVTVPDTEVNTTYGITLIGRNYSGYGVFLNDNFVSLLENFANGTPPATPVTGQLWFNTTNKLLQIWNGAAWKPIAASIASGSTPSSSTSNVGDFWWDTSTQQLKVYAGSTVANVLSTLSTTHQELQLVSTESVRVGDNVSASGLSPTLGITVVQILSATNVSINTPVTITNGQSLSFTRGQNWNLIGPSYSLGQNITGIVPTDIVDTVGITHTVSLLYQQGFVVGAVSRDNEFVPAASNSYARLPSIKPGITLISDAAPQFVRTVEDNVVGSNGTTTIPLSSVSGLQIGDYVITSNIAYSSFIGVQAIYPSNSSIKIGAATTVSLGDTITFQRGTAQAHLFNGTAVNAQQLDGVTADNFAVVTRDEIFQQDIAVRGNLYVGGPAGPVNGAGGLGVWDNSGDLNLYNNSLGGDWNIYANISGINTRVLYVDGQTGLAQVFASPTAPLGVATKQYVDTAKGVALSAITANVTSIINGAPVSKRDFGNVATILDSHTSQIGTLQSVVTTLATLDSPILTGTPTAPTPAAYDNDTSIATTAFVQTVVGVFAQQAVANASARDATIALKANIANPDFSGIPKVPHIPDATTRTRQIATTSFVGNVVDNAINGLGTTIGSLATSTSPVFDGTPKAPTMPNLTYGYTAGTTTSLGIVSTGGDDTIATTGFVANAIATMPSANLTPYATKVSPTFEGTPRGTLAPATAANSWIATTQWVSTYSPVLSVNGKTGAVVLGVSDITGVAPLNSPTFTGTPSLYADPPVTDSTQRIATTNWVTQITANLASQTSPTFIGTVTLPAPADNSNDTTGATTGWVTARIAQASVPKWSGAAKFVSSQAPSNSQGSDGDIWFQYQTS